MDETNNNTNDEEGGLDNDNSSSSSSDASEHDDRRFELYGYEVGVGASSSVDSHNNATTVDRNTNSAGNTENAEGGTGNDNKKQQHLTVSQAEMVLEAKRRFMGEGGSRHKYTTEQTNIRGEEKRRSAQTAAAAKNKFQPSLYRARKSAPPSLLKVGKYLVPSSRHDDDHVRGKGRTSVVHQKHLLENLWEGCKPILKTFGVGIFMVAIGLLAIIVGPHLGRGAKQQLEKPTPPDDEQQFQQIFPQHVMDALREDVHSPESRAFTWFEKDKLVNHDHAAFSQIRQLQRFVLATLYYATNGEHWSKAEGWLDHDVHECHWDIEHLVCFQMSSSNACHWEVGINATCRLVSLNLRRNDLEGTLPLEIGLLTDLLILELTDNRLSGALPRTIGELTKLRILMINENNFTSTIPTEIGKLSDLVSLDISRNRFEGTLPDQIQQLSNNLFELLIQENNITGITDQIGDLTGLQVLNLSNNKFNGPIPTVIGKLSSLHTLTAGECGFTGTIPTELLEISKTLVSLSLPNNSLNGTFHFPYKKLEYLDLSHNHLMGPLPTNDYHSFPKIKHMILDRNRFTGVIPSDVGSLTTLEELDISRNRLNGTIPTTLSHLRQLRVLILQHDNDDDENSVTSLESVHDVNENVFDGSVPTELCHQITAGLKLTVNCHSVSCDCGCICAEDNHEEQ